MLIFSVAVCLLCVFVLRSPFGLAALATLLVRSKPDRCGRLDFDESQDLSMQLAGLIEFGFCFKAIAEINARSVCVRV